MRPLPQDEARRWFDQAQQDLADARYMAEGSRNNVACFLAQPGHQAGRAGAGPRGG